MQPYEPNREYKTVVLIGGELNNIQVVLQKDEKIFEAVVSKPSTWEIKYYHESYTNPLEFVLQE